MTFLAWLALLNEATTMNTEQVIKRMRENVKGENKVPPPEISEENSGAARGTSAREAEPGKAESGRAEPEKTEQKKAENAGEDKSEAKVQGETEEKQDIRVIIMDSGYTTYYHPAVTVLLDGESVSYTMESPEFSDGPVVLEAGESGIEVTSIERQDGHPVYSGALKIERADEGLLLLNTLPLESYLEAVVPSEMPSSYEQEALRAQAVCARTYARKQIEEGRLGEYGADVDDSVNYQVYRNISPQESTTRAVRDTKGEVLVQGGELIEAYYFSTSAGVTSTDEIWGAQESASYLKSVVCSFDGEEPWSRWETTLPWERLEEKAAALENCGGALRNLEAVKKNESGAVTGLCVYTEEGNCTISGEYEIREFLSPEGCMIAERDGTRTEGGKLLPSAYFTMETEAGASVTITGGGYGHGVGMSQNGADEMAKEGYRYEEILHYFFRDVTLEKTGGV